MDSFQTFIISLAGVSVVGFVTFVFSKIYGFQRELSRLRADILIGMTTKDDFNSLKASVEQLTRILYELKGLVEGYVLENRSVSGGKRD
jgi:hypothetical protein